jgi:hypothetical protein
MEIQMNSIVDLNKNAYLKFVPDSSSKIFTKKNNNNKIKMFFKWVLFSERPVVRKTFLLSFLVLHKVLNSKLKISTFISEELIFKIQGSDERNVRYL